MQRHFLEFAAPPLAANERDAGRQLLATILAYLETHGIGSFEGVVPWDDYGWSITLDAGGRPFWCMLQRSDQWLLISWAQLSFMDRVRSRSESAEAGIIRQMIAEAVAGIATTADKRWLSEQEFHRGSISR